MHKRSITWSQLLSTTDKPVDKSTDGLKKKVKGSEDGIITERANKTKDASKILIIEDPIVIVAAVPGDSSSPDNDKDKGKGMQFVL